MPDDSLASALAPLQRELPHALLDDEGRQRVLAVARKLPCALARRSVGYELRLAGAARADLIVGARPHAPDGRALLEWARRSGLPQLALALEQWRSGFGWLAWNARYLLLEFDAASDVRAPPCIHLAPQRAANERPVAVSDNAFAADPEGLVRVLAALAGTAPDRTAVGSLKRLLAALPPFAEMFVAGAMLSRASVRSPRVAVRRLRPSGVAAVLRELGKSAAAERLVPLAEELTRAGARLMLDVDLGASAPALAGLEAHAGSYWTEGGRDGWAPVLEVLVSRGLAEPERATAAAALPGRRWPGGPTFGISHAKVGADASGLRPAKLYLGVIDSYTAVAPAAELAVGVG